jgi:alginate O-acetyltransferase complex protein AlgJ
MNDSKVLLGKENWLFLQNDTNRIVEQNTGKLSLTLESYAKWVRTLQARTAILNSQGISYYFLVPPNKECVYPEYLPDDYKISEDRIVNQLMNQCQGHNIKIYYPLELFELYKSESLLYSLVNTHWNGIGAFIAYDLLMNAVKKHINTKILTWQDIYYEEKIAAEDLGNKLTPMQSSPFVWGRVQAPQAQVIFDNQAANSGRKQITFNKNTALPTAVIFHDSFMEMILPYLMESFSKIYLFHTPCVNYDFIEAVKPDVVITEMVERFLVQIPVDF